jgi:hypothetical protein
MSLRELQLREVVRALCVVALVFLNFGHAPLALAGGEFAVTPQASMFCGDPIDSPEGAKGNPCQACRIGASADLPPPPGGTALAFRRASYIAYEVHAAPARDLRCFGAGGPRAPPAI